MILNTHTEKAIQMLKEKGLLDNEYKGVLLIKDCVLIERYTGKSYTYTLFNYISGEKKYIGHCKKRADKSMLIKVLPKIMKRKYTTQQFLVVKI